MPDTAARRRMVDPVVDELGSKLPFGPGDVPPTVRPQWIEAMAARFRFSSSQAAFTAHVAALGGLFTTRQAEFWLRGNWAEWSAEWTPPIARRARIRFLQPLFCPAGQRSAVARAFTLSESRPFTHIGNRSAYDVLAHPNSRYRRLPALPGILQRLTAYDYVLEHSALRWYALSRAKLDLMHALGVPRAELPQRTYHSRFDDRPVSADARTVQYFVDHFPIGISPGWRVVFVFVAEASRPRGLYGHVVSQYSSLFRVLRARGLRVSVVALSVPGAPLPPGERQRFRDLASAPSELDRRRLFLHVEAQLLKRAVRARDRAVLATYGGPDGVERHMGETRRALVDLRGVANRPTDVFFWDTERLRRKSWSTAQAVRP